MTTENAAQPEVRYLTEPGVYHAVAQDWGLDSSGEKGTASLAIEFRVISGPHEGELIHAWLYLTDKALDISVRSLRRLGWKGNDLNELDNKGGNLATPVMIDCQIEEYNGQSSLKVKWINQLGPQRRAPGAEFAGFAEAMKARVAAIGAESPKRAGARTTPPTNGTTPPSPGDMGDTSIPF